MPVGGGRIACGLIERLTQTRALGRRKAASRGWQLLAESGLTSHRNGVAYRVGVAAAE